MDGVSRALFYKNWSKLEGVVSSPRVIKSYKVDKKYLFEIEVNLTQQKLLGILRESFTEANADFELSSIIQDNNYFHIELDLRKNDKNILTAIFLVAEKLKNYDVKTFDYCRLVCEKEIFIFHFSFPFRFKIKTISYKSQFK